MGLADIWSYIKLGLDLKQALSLGYDVATTSTLNAMDDAIDLLVEKYAKHKDTDQNIRAGVNEVLEFLQGLAYPKLSVVPTSVTAANNAYKAYWAMLARDKILRIYDLQQNNKLPPDPLPWSRRRAILIGQRDALTRFGFQVDAAVRRLNKDIDYAESAEDTIRSTARDPGITPEEQLLLKQDWDDWVKTEQDERAQRDMMENVARTALNHVQWLNRLIQSGDQASVR